MARILIAAAPVDEPTRYAYSYWRRYAITPARNGHQVIFLRHATLQSFIKALRTYDPRLVILDGHGGAKAAEINNHVLLGVNSYDPLLGRKIYGTNTQLMAGRIVYLATCNAGKELAFRLIDAGAIAVAAYREPFIFLTENQKPDPLTDLTARPFFISLMQLALQMANDRSFGAAAASTRKAFAYYRDLAESNRDDEAAKYLHFDSLNFIAIGDMAVSL